MKSKENDKTELMSKNDKNEEKLSETPYLDQQMQTSFSNYLTNQFTTIISIV